MASLKSSQMAQHKIEALRQVPVLAPAHERELEVLSTISTLVDFGKGHLFYQPEDCSQAVYMLTKGRIHLYRLNPEGKKLIVDILGTGALFDDMALLNDNVHHSFAEAADACTVLVVDRTAFRDFVMRNPQILLNVMQHVASRMRSIEEKMERIAFQNLPARFSHLLLDLAQRQGSSTVIGFTHQELAESVGTYRETATQVLNSLQSEGHINISRQRIAILQPEQLAATAGVY
jgi:CRP/FNR family transcriptional regulator, cyclic AMP receptor protein